MPESLEENMTVMTPMQVEKRRREGAAGQDQMKSDATALANKLASMASLVLSKKQSLVASIDAAEGVYVAGDVTNADADLDGFLASVDAARAVFQQARDLQPAP